MRRDPITPAAVFRLSSGHLIDFPTSLARQVDDDSIDDTGEQSVILEAPTLPVEQQDELPPLAASPGVTVAEARRFRSASGAKGMNAFHGDHGQNHDCRPGARGGNGQAAARALRGQDGGAIDLKIGSLLMTSSRLDNVSEETNWDFWRDAIVLEAHGGDGGDGGVGGNGANGILGNKGRNASRSLSGGNGGPGGNGGDAGEGTSGADGGNGGNVTITVASNETFLLMSFENLHKPSLLVKGGSGGRPGRHGNPGKGGPGGLGGNPYHYTTTHHYKDSDGNRRTKTKHHTSPGGRKGRPGNPGQVPSVRLTPGISGSNGSVAIRVVKPHSAFSGLFAETIYTQRYDLKLSHFSLSARYPVGSSSAFQFGDTVQLSNITAMNVGGMPTPNEDTRLQIVGHASLLPNLEDRAILNGQVPQMSRTAQGSLSFHIPRPSKATLEAMGEDHAPYSQICNLKLDAIQLGPYDGRYFARSYPAFDLRGKQLKFEFPIQNYGGFECLASLLKNESIRIRFPLENICNHDIGWNCIGSTPTRQLMVQFRRLKANKYKLPIKYIKLVMENVKCEDLESTEDIWWGTVISIPRVPAQSEIFLEGILSVSEKVEPYSRIAIQAGLVLQDIPINPDNPTFSLIQKRRLEIVSEPAYRRKDNSQVILVSSSATTKQQFDQWKLLLEDQLHLEVEYLPISVYGSLDANFILPSGQTNARAFANKLVIVLDDEFNPSYEEISAMRPSYMLPKGCMAETSGYDRMTRWLFVGSGESLVKHQLLFFFSDRSTKSFQKAKDFKRHLAELLKQEQSLGRLKPSDFHQHIWKYEIPIRVKGTKSFAQKHLYNAASKLADHIRSCDSIHQYVIEVQEIPALRGKHTFRGNLIVHRGYCRSLDSASVVMCDAQNILSRGMAFSVWKSMPIPLRIDCFCAEVALRNQDNVSMMLDTFGLDLLWEVANFKHARFECISGSEFDSNFPVITNFLGNESVSTLRMKEATQAISAPFSDLVARFECISDSKDMRGLRALFNNNKRTIRKHLMTLVARLRTEWEGVIDDKLIANHKKRAQAKVKNYLGKLRVPQHKKLWKNGLRYIMANNPDYAGAWAERLTNLPSKIGMKSLPENIHIDKPLVEVRAANKCQDQMQMVKRQQVQAAELATAIRQARDAEVLSDDNHDTVFSTRETIRFESER